MITDEPVPDDRVESLTVRHLRDFRRTQDLYLDLLKRQTEMTGRLARDVAEFKLETDKNFNELRSDILLLENRSITAAGNDEFFRRKLASLEEDLASLKENLSSLQGDVASVRDDLASVKGNVASVRGDVASVRGDVASVMDDLASVRGDVAFVRGDVPFVKGDVASLKADMTSVKESLARIESALTSR